MKFGYNVLDSGHLYEPMSIDGDYEQDIQFVKRIDREDPTVYPGNTGTPHPGTTLQCVIRILADRVRYLQGQKPCVENLVLLHHLQESLWLLEKRAARRHGMKYNESPEFAMRAPVCSVCGHTICEHEER